MLSKYLLIPLFITIFTTLSFSQKFHFTAQTVRLKNGNIKGCEVNIRYIPLHNKLVIGGHEYEVKDVDLRGQQRFLTLDKGTALLVTIQDRLIEVELNTIDFKQVNYYEYKIK